MFPLASLLCSCFSAAIAVLVAGALLKISVNVANRIIRPTKKETQGEWGDWDWDDWDDEYDTPARPQIPKLAIPEPGIGKCMVIMFLTGVLGVLGFVLLGFAAEAALDLRMQREETKLAVAVVELPAVFLTLTVMLVAFLPTTFWRAAMISFLYGFMLFAFVLVIGLGTAFFVFLIR